MRYNIFSCLLIIFTLFGCGKDNPKHLISGKWVADGPTTFTFMQGGGSIGVGGGEEVWEIQELDFTDALEGPGDTPYFGLNGKMIVNGSDYEWGYWEYKDYSKSPGNLLNAVGNHTVPEELLNEKRVVGELWRQNGVLRFYVFEISKSKMRIAFCHIEFSSGGAHVYTYSPIMNFKKV